MKLKILKTHLLTAMGKTIDAIAGRGNMPILECVLIRSIDDKSIRITATNLDLEIGVSVIAEIAKRGAFCIPAKKFISIVKEIPSDYIEIEGRANDILVSGAASRFKMRSPSLDGSEYPEMKKTAGNGITSFTMEQSELGSRLFQVENHSSHDDNRYVLNSVFFELKSGNGRVVATDGRRLSLSNIDADLGGGDGSAILPHKLVQGLARVIGVGHDVRVDFNASSITLTIEAAADNESGLTGDIVVCGKLVEGKYPDYHKVIPDLSTFQRIEINTAKFMGAIKRASLVTNDSSMSVQLTCSGNTITIKAQSSEFGNAVEEIELDGGIEACQVAFNPQFVMDSIKTISEDHFCLYLKDELTPGVFQSLEGDYTSIVMPLRL